MDDIQYKDGRNIVNVGRDDQAGFRLDTMTTSKQHASLCLKDNIPLTTRTDYVNPYPSVLQTTCYNFAATETTNEVCAGVVNSSSTDFFENFQKNFFWYFEFLDCYTLVVHSFFFPRSNTVHENSSQRYLT